MSPTRIPAGWHGLRIVIIGPLPPPGAGMANQTRQLCRLLAGEGAVVEVVRVNAPYRPAWIRRVRGLRAVVRLVPYLLALWRAASRADLFHVMANSGWSWHLFAAPAIRIASCRGVPVVVNYRGGNAETFLARSIARVRPTLERASAVAVPSRFLQEIFEKRGIAARIVPNIIDTDRFTPGPERQPGQPPHLIVARNLEPLYDVATALRAFHVVRTRFPEARLTVAGAGSLESPLRRLVAGLGISDAVTFTGQVDNDALAAVYRTAHLMLNPSLADNAPISILEGLASGLVVVSTDVGGVPFLVEHGHTALLVSPRDHDAMARAAIRLLSDPDEARAMRTAGLDQVRRHSWPAVRHQLLDLYANHLAGPRPALAHLPS